ncbi:hypothetical protein KCP75_01570 [Salmonella enterica subsp. enterica]|nr:hypothetical protein KCP75_01570 [Salmonella enterica subsp. enterica]
MVSRSGVLTCRSARPGRLIMWVRQNGNHRTILHATAVGPGRWERCVGRLCCISEVIQPSGNGSAIIQKSDLRNLNICHRTSKHDWQPTLGHCGTPTQPGYAGYRDPPPVAYAAFKPITQGG